MKRKIKGFTIIELVVVCAIIAMLSTVVFVGLNNSKAKSRDARRVSEIDQIKNAFVMYNEDNDGYPVISGYTAGSYMSYTTGGTATYSGLTAAISPYLSPIPIDPKDGTRVTLSGYNRTLRYFIDIKSNQAGVLIRSTLENSENRMNNDGCGTSNHYYYDVISGDFAGGVDGAADRCTNTYPGAW